MSRIRLSLIVGGLVLAMAAPVTVFAQGGGRGGPGGGFGGPGGGRGGPGGFFGGFGGGFGGFGGGSLVSLATREPVQEELKITEAQKAKLSDLSTKADAKNREVFDNLRQQSDASRAQLRNQQENVAANMRNQQSAPRTFDPRNQALAGVSGPGGGYASNPYTAGLPQQNGVDPNVLRQQFREQDSEARAQSRMMMQQAMTQLRNSSEQALGKILDRNQMRRLREIQLQSEGPFAVLQPEMTQKLEIQEDQVAELQQAQNTINGKRGQVRSQMRDVFSSFRSSQDGANANANGDSNTQAGNRGPGGPGGNRRGFDPEAMRQFMEKPEVQAKMDQMRKDEEALTDEGYSLVFKTLDRRQGGAFKKMLGEKFDLSLLRRRPGGPGGPGGPPPANGNAPATATATATAPAPATAAAPAAAPATATAPQPATGAGEAPKAAAPAAKAAPRRRGSR